MMRGGARSGANRRAGWGVNVSTAGWAAAARGARAGLGQQRGVSEVDAVEVSDRDRQRRGAAGSRGRRRGEAGRAGHDPHGRGAVTMLWTVAINVFELERLFDDPLVRHAERRAAPRRHAGHQRERRAGERSSASSAGSCAGPDEPATMRSLSTAAGVLPCARPVARGAHVAHQRGREAGLAQDLDHEASDVHVVFDDENYFSSH